MKDLKLKLRNYILRYNSLNTAWRICILIIGFLFLLNIVTSKFVFLYITQHTDIVEYTEIISSFGIIRVICAVSLLLLLVLIICLKGKVQMKFSKKDIIVKEIEKDSCYYRKLRITLFNRNQTHYYITKMRLKWKYRYGVLCSIEQGTVIESAAIYNIHFKLNVDDCEWHEEVLQFSNLLAIPAGVSDSPSVTVFDCDLTYEHIGKLNYHPNTGWNIEYTILIVDNEDNECVIVEDFHWNGNDRYKSIELR